LTKWNHITTELGDMSTITSEQVKLLIKDPIESLTLGRKGEHALKMTKSVHDAIKADCPQTLREYPFALFRALKTAESGIRIAKECGCGDSNARVSYDERDKRNNNSKRSHGNLNNHGNNDTHK
jgi:hypothetical protein